MLATLATHTLSGEYEPARDGQHDVVDQLAHRQHRRAQQQTHEAADLTEQTQERKCRLLLDARVAQVLVEDVHLEEVAASNSQKNIHMCAFLLSKYKQLIKYVYV